ncbi:ADL314Cp [Eremothecium gossypii ATCC 10895]|uniref:ADL314Cp n=1 Tax=Eremothecium gossypii (strain ATCC 10895 / CBS 109.51 / FGSC 9923 / NRRL Y-1056) TaxID=284811 RepID=Q75B84_EREGS|nr:ADL314Cp [Eremothecium gossypii ATCC 10895]AAS51606.1 ADL314Cp [Eremothecium gossypii ATCC 10895]
MANHWWTAARTLFALFLASSYKSLPGAYFVRFAYYLTKNLLLPKVLVGRTGSTANMRALKKDHHGAFRRSVIHTYCSPFECDFYLHKNNATYFEELDFSRTDLMTSVFQQLFLRARAWPYLPVANVFTGFRKEIAPFQRYTIDSCVLCWDDKWIYVLSRFMLPGVELPCAVSITTYVFKDGRRTITPREALEACELYNEDVEHIAQENLKTVLDHNSFTPTDRLYKLTHCYTVL